MSLDAAGKSACATIYEEIWNHSALGLAGIRAADFVSAADRFADIEWAGGHDQQGFQWRWHR
jgi:hypothetical protein